jgi:hypothetical protein
MNLMCGTHLLKGIRWAGHVARIRGMSNAHKIRVRKPEEKKLGITGYIQKFPD